MMYGYARVSTTDQEAGLEAQKRDLIAAIGLTAAYHIERASAVGDRPVLEKLLLGLKRGDVLIVTKLDRLARNVGHLSEIVERIEKVGASLRILALGMDTATPTGKLMLNVLGAVAQFEREIMLERQREGIEVAKLMGKYTGRAASVDARKVKEFVEVLDKAGKPAVEAVALAAKQFKISTRQVYRHLKA